MSLQELETAVETLPADQLAAFKDWFDNYLADQWDKQIEADILAGKLDQLGQQAVQDLHDGKCAPR